MLETLENIAGLWYRLVLLASISTQRFSVVTWRHFVRNRWPWNRRIPVFYASYLFVAYLYVGRSCAVPWYIYSLGFQCLWGFSGDEHGGTTAHYTFLLGHEKWHRSEDFCFLHEDEQVCQCAFWAAIFERRETQGAVTLVHWTLVWAVQSTCDLGCNIDIESCNFILGLPLQFVCCLK